MTDRTLDIQVALLLGWQWVGDDAGVRYLRREGQPGYLAMEAGGDVYAIGVPHYSTDIAAAKLVEDEIERQNKHARYLDALCRILWDGRFPAPLIKDGRAVADMDELWSLIRATPAQRCRAALTITEGGGG